MSEKHVTLTLEEADLIAGMLIHLREVAKIANVSQQRIDEIRRMEQTIRFKYLDALRKESA